jgi:hypothetical protein
LQADAVAASPLRFRIDNLAIGWFGNLTGCVRRLNYKITDYKI